MRCPGRTVKKMSVLTNVNTKQNYWYWRLRPQFGYLEMGFIKVNLSKQFAKEPYKVIPKWRTET